MHSCRWLHKDTNLKAIHNTAEERLLRSEVVADYTKILIWKQFTTVVKEYICTLRCRWLHKDTNLKAIHNYLYDEFTQT